jgi:hypothetical protein
VSAEYQKEFGKAHREMEKDLTTKIWLQQEAIRAIPDHLVAAALVIDDTPPPGNPWERPFPNWDTPPIPGFNPADYENASADKAEASAEGSAQSSDTKKK